MDSLPGEETLVASWQALARLSPGAHVSHGPRTIRAVFPAWGALNNAIVRGPRSTSAAREAAAELTPVYAAAAVHAWALWVRSSSTDLDTPSALSAVEGLTRDTTTLVMTRTLTPGSAHPGVVRTSIDAAGRASDEPVRHLPPPDLVPGLDGWVLVHEGAAVAGAWSYLHGTDCGVYAVGTVPHLRRRGLASALVRHVLADAYRRGARTASLQSTRMGQALYRSLGFGAVGRYEEWTYRSSRPPSSVSPMDRSTEPERRTIPQPWSTR